MRHPAFSQVDHRPWPLPSSPWIMKQQWKDLLFLHWEVPYEELRVNIPSELEIDTHDGKAYIALVPFEMKGITGRYCPAPPLMCDFPELNVRTYVTYKGKPGVWFFSLDISNSLAVWAARNIFNLSYRKAEMSYRKENERITFSSSFSGNERFKAQYKAGKKLSPSSLSLERWVTERYCLYTFSRKGTLYRGEIQHPQWELHTAEVSLKENSMLDQFTLGEMSIPLFCPKIDVVVYPLERLT